MKIIFFLKSFFGLSIYLILIFLFYFFWKADRKQNNNKKNQKNQKNQKKSARPFPQGDRISLRWAVSC